MRRMRESREKGTRSLDDDENVIQRGKEKDGMCDFSSVFQQLFLRKWQERGNKAI